MSITATLNSHIRSLARRELKPLLAKALKRSADHRRSIASLKRELRQVRGELATVKKRMPERVKEIPSKVLEKSRLRIDGLKGHRNRLGLSAKEYGQLLGVSSLTVYNWENGKSKPRRSQLPNIVAVRGIGKREAMERLGEK